MKDEQAIPKGKNIKVIGVMKDELGRQIMKEFVGLRTKICNYLKDNNDEDKKEKSTKKCVIKRKLKFQDHKNCLEAAQIENKINHSEKNKINVDKKNNNNKNNKLISKTQQRFKRERHNVLTEEINKIQMLVNNVILISSNDDKRMQSIDSIETYAYGRSKDLVSKKEEIKCNAI